MILSVYDVEGFCVMLLWSVNFLEKGLAPKINNLKPKKKKCVSPNRSNSDIFNIFIIPDNVDFGLQCLKGLFCVTIAVTLDTNYFSSLLMC